MNRLAASIVACVIVATGCARRGEPAAATPAPHVSAKPAPTSKWIVTQPDGLYSIETPVPATPSEKVAGLWSAEVSPELVYQFAAYPVPDAEPQLDDIAATVANEMRGAYVETIAVHGRAARLVTGSSKSGRPMLVEVIADGDRLFMFTVIGAAPAGASDRFFGSFRILAQ
jgi:hypothetical protein